MSRRYDHPLQAPIADQLAALDSVKRMVAVCALHALVTGKGRPPLMRQPAGVSAVTGRALSALVTEVTVQTEFGPRYFLVKVSETSPAGRAREET